MEANKYCDIPAKPTTLALDYEIIMSSWCMSDTMVIVSDSDKNKPIQSPVCFTSFLVVSEWFKAN